MSARLGISTSKKQLFIRHSLACTFVAIASREPCLPADVIARYLDFYRRHRHFNRTNTPHLIVVWCSRLYGKKRNVWEGRGTFKNFKWEWTKGSICLRSRVFHRPCRQLACRATENNLNSIKRYALSLSLLPTPSLSPLERNYISDRFFARRR